MTQWLNEWTNFFMDNTGLHQVYFLNNLTTSLGFFLTPFTYMIPRVLYYCNLFDTRKCID
jgi:hypothetical protein